VMLPRKGRPAFGTRRMPGPSSSKRSRPVGEHECERRLESAPRLRDGISLVRRGAAGQGVIVADREGRRHFLVGAVEGRLLALLDGTRRLREVHQLLAAEFPELDLPVETVAGFAARLEELGLLEGSALP